MWQLSSSTASVLSTIGEFMMCIIRFMGFTPFPTVGAGVGDKVDASFFSWLKDY